MEHVTSIDGTPIAYQQSGTGPPLILVHGAVTDHARWGPLTEFLQEHFTVYAMDRRGRGESGDSADYSWALEAEDVAAVANSIDGPVSLYGHSGGATFVLEAAPKIRSPHRLVLYEPAILSTDLVPPAFIDGLQRLLDQGDQEGVITTFLREIVKMPPHEIERLQALPDWWRRVGTAHTIPRELRGGNEYQFDPQRFVNMQVPTLLLVGSDSPALFKNSAKTIQESLPNSQTHELSGQQHLADVMVPGQVAGVLVEFLSEKAPQR